MDRKITSLLDGFEGISTNLEVVIEMLDLIFNNLEKQIHKHKGGKRKEALHQLASALLLTNNHLCQAIELSDEKRDEAEKLLELGEEE